MKLNNNVKLLLGSIATWFILSILLIIVGTNPRIVTVLFCILSISLVGVIYRVLYLEFYYKSTKKYRKKLEQGNIENKNEGNIM